MHQRLLISAFLAALVVPIASAAPEFLPSSSPHVWLWAWQRAESLPFIDPHKVGVAYLAQTLTLSGGRVLVDRRVQPLVVPDGTKLTAVTRIEVRPRDDSSFTDEQMNRCVEAILSTAQTPAVQIDFDARLNQRPFYKQLLTRLRENLPREKRLSMTALASWATFDTWLSDAPVDEVVPMFFSMGADKQRILMFMQEGRSLQERCSQAIGVSVQDMPTARSVLNAARVEKSVAVYVFSRRPWTRQSVADALSLWR